MKCTKCGGNFKPVRFKGVDVERCKDCRSVWLDYNKLDQLEDRVWNTDESKGSLFVGDEPSKIHCPRCDMLMKKIKYRFYDLEIEVCPDSCGFYLDAGEEKRMLELLKNDKEADKRKLKSEDQWENIMEQLRSRSFLEKLRNYLQK